MLQLVDQPRVLAATPLLTQHSGEAAHGAQAGADCLVATQVQGCLWFAAALKVVLLLAWLGIAGLLAYAYLDEWLSDSGGYSRIYLLLSLSFVAADFKERSRMTSLRLDARPRPERDGAAWTGSREEPPPPRPPPRPPPPDDHQVPNAEGACGIV